MEIARLKGAITARELWRMIDTGYEIVGFDEDTEEIVVARYYSPTLAGTRGAVPGAIRNQVRAAMREQLSGSESAPAPEAPPPPPPEKKMIPKARVKPLSKSKGRLDASDRLVRKAYDTLRTMGALTPAQIRMLIDEPCTPSSMNHALRRALAAGLIERLRYGVYAVRGGGDG